MKKKNNKFQGHRFSTLSVHSGQKLDKDFKARAVPIYQTTAYVFDSTSEAASIFNLDADGNSLSPQQRQEMLLEQEKILKQITISLNN